MLKQKITKEQIDNLVNRSSSLNYDYLTHKELNRIDKFVKTLYMDQIPDSRRLSEYNGFTQYVESLQKKIESRKNIPIWYIQNKI